MRLNGITIKLIVLMFILLILEAIIPQMTYWLYLVPANLLERPWTIVTAAFVHAGLIHWLFNSWGILVFGTEIERRMGSKFLLALFIAGAVAGSLGYVIYMTAVGEASIGGLGASGALFALIGFVTIMFPSMIILWFWVPMPMLYAGIIWMLIELFSLGSNDLIANSAHLAGWVLGAGVAYVMRKSVLKTGFIDIKRYTKALWIIAGILFLVALSVAPQQVSTTKTNPLNGWDLVSKGETGNITYEIYELKGNIIKVEHMPQVDLRKVIKDRLYELTGNKQDEQVGIIEEGGVKYYKKVEVLKDNRVAFSMGTCNSECTIITGVVDKNTYLSFLDN